jgi:hypothetical protein
VSLPTTSPGGNDEDNSPAAWTARSGEGTAGGCIGTAGSSRERRERGDCREQSGARGLPGAVRSAGEGRHGAVWSAGKGRHGAVGSAGEGREHGAVASSSRREQERPVQSRRRAALG